MRVNEQQKKILFYISVLGFYILAFWGVIRSWYMADDLINYTSQGYCINNNISVFDLTIQQAKLWYTQVGRCFVFSSYTYILFSIVKNVYLYKFLIVLVTCLDAIILAKLIGLIVSSKKIMIYIILIFPALISLDCGYFNAMYGFHGLIQLCLLWCLISMFAFWKYLKTDKTRWQVVSCCALSIALGTYEVAYVLCVLFPVLAFIDTKRLISTVKKILPQTITGVVWLAWNMIARMQAASEYVGTKMNLGAECVETFFKQLSGSCTFFSILRAQDILTGDNVKSILKTNGIRYFILVVFVCMIFGWTCKYKENTKNIAWGYVIGGIIAAGPAVLVALSERYQHEISWGRGYLPAFVSCWGIVICVALFIVGVKNGYARFGASIICAAFLVISLMISDITVQQYNQTMIDPFVAEAVETGILDTFKEDDILVDGSGNWTEFDSHYAFLLQRKANVVSVNNLYEIQSSEIHFTDYYDKIKEKKEFYYAGFQKDSHYYMASCVNLDVQMCDNNVEKNIFTDRFDIYIFNQVEADCVIYETRDGIIKEITLGESNMKKKTEKGYLYTIDLKELVDVETITIK